MSRITGTDVLGIIEAYSAVYTPEEVSEEKIWEEVENWVNSLVEEGNDLSEYTWEEMYEAYITEIGVNFGGQAAVDKARAQQKDKSAFDAKLAALRTQRFGSGGSPSASNPATASSTPSSPSKSRFAGARDAAFKRAQGIKGSPVVGSKPSALSGGTPAPAASPSGSAPAAKPAPTPASPGSGPAVSGSGKGKPPVATSSQQKAQQASQQQRSSGQSSTPSQQWAKANPALAAAEDEKKRIRGTAQTDNPLIDQGMRSRMPAGTPTVQSPDVAKLGSGNQRLVTNPYAGRSATGSKKPGSIVSSFDMFDVVMGHLIGEGYADTEESALKIMANMSEDWRNSIIIDESQRARENPEGHDREEKKKYEKVRGERTPMPPRGNKDREAFEKWYAKNVR